MFRRNATPPGRTFLMAITLTSMMAGLAEPVRGQSVSVHVSMTTNESIDSQVASYLKRELRLLGDVDLVNTLEEANVALAVVAMPSIVDGRTVGFFMAVAVIEPLAGLESVLEPLVPPEGDSVFHQVAAYMKDAALFHNLMAYSGPMDDLREKCAEVVAVIDVHYLDSYRLQIRQLPPT